MTAPHARTLDRDTVLCISLAARPSNIGTRFHNYLYNLLGLNYVYKAFAPADIAAAVQGLRGLPIRGAAVSMPYKETVIDLVDVMEQSAAAIESVNTIVNDDGVLRAYNTDYQAVADLLAASSFDRDAAVAVAGSGGMAKAVVAALRDTAFTDVTVVARNAETGRALADKYGFAHVAELGGVRPAILVNATPIGMAVGAAESELPFAREVVDAAVGALDVVAMPPTTPLVQAMRARGAEVISGDAVIAGQAAAQFELYTGVTPTAEQIREASEYSRK
ncbi:shikimate 5-dehydrogenase [Gordonia sp. HY285]|uniref:shikimate dehydrogenase (NADP(+)) n=1 Tax=Gordonia liuliyuniae TaxID=2911517 RepID=A0ABS9IXD5_9ACTN|nr:shikimate 5-dehydrogenase [Gordonia liuliyuniae]MCF8590237.1 shikimate 5-dehydrogenase [Gordonia liuliyuniae]MCF8611852.1 shikimate 5-dehydrogenase [Gordonia liuliyuniae]